MLRNFQKNSIIPNKPNMFLKFEAVAEPANF